MDTSSELIHSTLHLFLAVVLAVGGLWVGVREAWPRRWSGSRRGCGPLSGHSRPSDRRAVPPIARMGLMSAKAGETIEHRIARPAE